MENGKRPKRTGRLLNTITYYYHYYYYLFTTTIITIIIVIAGSVAQVYTLMTFPSKTPGQTQELKIQQRGGSVETGCSDLYRGITILVDYMILPQSTAPPSHCTPL